MSEANIYRNAVISLLHHIECLACLIYADQYRRYGVNWVRAHYMLLTEGGTRWLEEPRWQWFGLSNHEMAEIHHARGVILKVVAEVLHEFRTLWDAASLESAMRKEQEAAQDILRNSCTRKTSFTTGSLPSMLAVPPNSLAQNINIVVGPSTTLMSPGKPSNGWVTGEW
jgi:hypothetical protein